MDGGGVEIVADKVVEGTTKELVAGGEICRVVDDIELLLPLLLLPVPGPFAALTVQF